MSIKDWVEPGGLSDAGFSDEPKVNVETKNDDSDSNFDVASMLPLLMNSGGDMTQMLGGLLKGQKIGGIDVGAMLPLLMNSGLFTKKDVAEPGKIIDLNDYRRVD